MQKFLWLWILLAVLLFLFCLFLCPVCIDVKWDSGFSYTGRFLFFRFPKKKKHKQKKATEKKEKPEKPAEKGGMDAFFGKLGRLAAILRNETKPVCKFLHRVRVQRVVFSAALAAENPATAAIRYGEVFALFHNFQAFFAHLVCLELSEPKVTVWAEGEGEQAFAFSAQIRIPLYAALFLLLSGGKRLTDAANAQH